MATKTYVSGAITTAVGTTLVTIVTCAAFAIGVMVLVLIAIIEKVV